MVQTGNGSERAESPSRALGAAVVFCSALIAAACQNTADPANDRDTPLTWEQAVVFLPNNKVVAMNDPEFRTYTERRTFPVLLYLHGSSGLRKPYNRNLSFLSRYAKELGMIVVATDSFARPNRSVHNTDMWTQERYNEIDYALAQLRSAPWADTQNLFLLGLSEGGIATARYNKPGFRAAVITGFHCRYHHHSVDLPNDVPVLNAQHQFDPTFYPRRGSGTCEDALKGRPGSGVFTWETPAVHNGNVVKKAQDKIIEFLGRNMR